MLSEDDIPGASLKSRKPNDLTVVQFIVLVGLLWATDRKVNLFTAYL